MNLKLFLPLIIGLVIVISVAVALNYSSTPVVVPPLINDTKPPIVNDTTPIPISQTKTVIMVGDLSGTAVLDAIKARNPDLVVALGDLGYKKDLSWFKSTYGQLAGKLACVPGNHEAPEDGSAKLYAETLAYCGNPYFIKLNSVLFIGLDTNGDTNAQLKQLKNLTTAEFMQNISSVHVMTHKPCAVPPNSHHPVETKAFCDGLKFNTTTYFDSAHNHVMSASADADIT